MQLEASGQVLQAELLYVKELERFPGDIEASSRLAHMAMQRGDSARAVSLLQAAAQVHPEHIRLAIDLAVVLANTERSPRRSRRSSRASGTPRAIRPPGSCWRSCGRRQATPTVRSRRPTRQ